MNLLSWMSSLSQRTKHICGFIPVPFPQFEYGGLQMPTPEGSLQHNNNSHLPARKGVQEVCRTPRPFAWLAVAGVAQSDQKRTYGAFCVKWLSIKLYAILPHRQSDVCPIFRTASCHVAIPHPTWQRSDVYALCYVPWLSIKLYAILTDRQAMYAI